MFRCVSTIYRDVVPSPMERARERFSTSYVNRCRFIPKLPPVEKKKETAIQRILQNLRFKYRLVVMNEETYEERYSLKLSQLNLFTAIGLIAIALILITTWVIAFTPLREYIPGYSSDVNMRRNLIELASKVDSLEKYPNRNYRKHPKR